MAGLLRNCTQQSWLVFSDRRLCVLSPGGGLHFRQLAAARTDMA